MALNVDPHDGNYAFLFFGDDNSSQISSSDILGAQKQISRYLDGPERAQAFKSLIDHFQEIDSDGSGFLTAHKTDAWIQKQGRNSQYSTPAYWEAVPHTTDRGLPGSEHVTKAMLQDRMDNVLAESRQIRESWGLPDNLGQK